LLVMALLIAPRDAKPGCPVLAPGLRERSPMATLAFSWYEQSPPALTPSASRPATGAIQTARIPAR
jgi:hypothetical protein